MGGGTQSRVALSAGSHRGAKTFSRFHGSRTSPALDEVGHENLASANSGPAAGVGEEVRDLPLYFGCEAADFCVCGWNRRGAKSCKLRRHVCHS